MFDCWTVLTAERCFSRWLFLKRLYIEYISHVVHDSTPNSFYFTGQMYFDLMPFFLLYMCSWIHGWSESCSVMSDSLEPHGLYSPWHSPVQNTGVGSYSLLQGIFAGRFFTTEPPGKPKTGVGSLFLPQGIFLTQECNRGLLHCGWILHQLSYQGSPFNGLGSV